MTHTIICPHCLSPLIDSSGLAQGAITCPDCAETIEPAQVAGQSPEWVAEKVAAKERPAQTENRSPKVADSSHTMNDVQIFLDAVGGFKWPWKDNMTQAVTIAATTVLGMIIGVAAAGFGKEQILFGVIFGALGGVMAGLFASILIVIICRLFKHWR